MSKIRKYLQGGGGPFGAGVGTTSRAQVQLEVQLVERKVSQVSNIQN